MTVTAEVDRSGLASSLFDVRVLIIEDHELLAQSLLHALRREGFVVELVTGPTVEDIVAFREWFRPTVVLLDLNLGVGLGSGLPFVRGFADSGARVVILTGVTDRIRLAECVEAGAVGIVHKEASFERLVGAIKEAATNRPLLSPDDRHALLSELRRERSRDRERLRAFERLTAREQEVLLELTQGHSAAQIAQTSYVSLSTVRSQIRSVLIKLGVTSQLAAVALAIRSGWISD
jgi:two-component system nitrate/nitrite response regulator NarL